MIIMMIIIRILLIIILIMKIIIIISVGTIIDYNRRLLGCLFHNDLSIMKLVIDNNRKI